MALVNRPVLSVGRAVYDFIASCPGRPRRLWESALYECRLMAALLPILGIDLASEWSRTMVASDA
eukprot:3583134-Lingulodinium_polyedra.AAC.1